MPTSPPISTLIAVPPTPTWHSDVCAAWTAGNDVEYTSAAQEYSEAATDASLAGDETAQQDFTVLAGDAAAVEDGRMTVSAYDSDVLGDQVFFADC